MHAVEAATALASRPLPVSAKAAMGEAKTELTPPPPALRREKPDEFYEHVRRSFAGPRLDLFAAAVRVPRPGG